MNLGTVGQPDGVIRLKGGQSRLQVKVDGHAAGVFKSLETEENGNLYAKFDNGQSELVGRLAVGVFNNPDGLEMLEYGLYLPNIKKSGNVTYAYIGEAIAGNVAVGALESSTIETIPQMAKMIERQQQFNNIITAYSGKKDLWELINSLRS
jgi:flagellar hook protein FlgE